MCGRYALYGPVSVSRHAKQAFDQMGLDLEMEVNQRDPQYNIAPTNRSLVIAHGGKGFTAQALRWGLIPFWAKDTKIGYNTINARDDSVDTKPSFREAFKKRRALVPATGYFEWKGEGTAKQPYFIHDPRGDLLLFCGLWESWRDAANPEAERLDTFTIIVGAAGPVSGDIHDRQPAIIAPGDWIDWLTGPPDVARRLLDERGTADLAYYPVSKAVGSVKNKGADLVERVDL